MVPYLSRSACQPASPLGTVIASGADRAQALRRLATAIDATRIGGVANNLSLHSALLADAQFRRGGVDTGFLSRWLAERSAQPLAARHG